MTHIFKRLFISFLSALIFPFGIIATLLTQGLSNIRIFFDIVVFTLITPLLLLVILYPISILILKDSFNPIGLAYYLSVPLNFFVFYFKVFATSKLEAAV